MTGGHVVRGPAGFAEQVGPGPRGLSGKPGCWRGLLVASGEVWMWVTPRVSVALRGQSRVLSCVGGGSVLGLEGGGKFVLIPLGAFPLVSARAAKPHAGSIMPGSQEAPGLVCRRPCLMPRPGGVSFRCSAHL